jgi:hypothetical protein
VGFSGKAIQTVVSADTSNSDVALKQE